jgi:addiction module RelE/StbE family toxin
MAYKVSWSVAAVEDVEEIATYIEKDSPRYAQAVVDRLITTARGLANFPMRGRIVPELADPTYRERFVHSYRLIYRIEADSVLIVAVIHGRRVLDTAADRFSEDQNS